MTIKVAINGFGRIGRCFLRQAINNDKVQVVAVNDLTDTKTLAHLFKYDSVHGPFNGTVTHDDKQFIINGKAVKVFSQKDPEQLPWKELGVDVVIESTGIFRNHADASKHLKAGARKVVISAPLKDPDMTLVMGVNHKDYNHETHHILSMASCTTNCLAPVAKLLDQNWGIESGLMTTIHSYTNDQRILDLPHSDLRRARAAALNMIPTTTGAAEDVAKVLPQLKGKLTGMAIRVPTPNVSVVDVVFKLVKDATAEEINKVFKTAAEGDLKGILKYSDEPLVSSDFCSSSYSSIVDAACTMVINKNHVKVLSWYDNEMGYSTRLVDTLVHMFK